MKANLINGLQARIVRSSETGKKMNIPMYLVFGTSYPVACLDFAKAIDVARELSSKVYNENEEIKIFDTMLGKFTGTYVNGKYID